MSRPPAVTTVNCPTCNDLVEWTEASPWRPFCSNRCRLLDLGAWFDEERAIPDRSEGGPETVPTEHGTGDRSMRDEN